MDPELRKKLFIRKNMSGILAVLAITLILPLTLVLSQTTTQNQQQAAGTEKQKSNNTQTTPITPQDYTLLMKCFDKPNQVNPCTPAQRKAADLNHDGVVDGIDYNLFIRQNTNKKAQ